MIRVRTATLTLCTAPLAWAAVMVVGSFSVHARVVADVAFVALAVAQFLALVAFALAPSETP